jgi:hypothetical protein
MNKFAFVKHLKIDGSMQWTSRLENELKEMIPKMKNLESLDAWNSSGDRPLWRADAAFWWTLILEAGLPLKKLEFNTTDLAFIDAVPGRSLPSSLGTVKMRRCMGTKRNTSHSSISSTACLS